MSLNFNWLLARMDEAHDHLCPGRIGTWQQRAEQVAEAAKAIRAKEIAPHNLLVVEPSAKSRILGGIYGSIVGDALGVPREFKSRESCKLNPVFGMEGFGSHGKPPGTWSDDSSLMLCTVDSIIDTGKIDADDLGKKFLAWRKHGLWTTDGHVFDIGIATSSALARIASGVPAIEAGGKGENSNGNGSLMRILPVSIWNAYHDDDAENCRIASSVTHGHRRSIMACHFHSILVESLMAGHSIEHAYTISVNGFRALYSEDPEFRHFAHLDEMLAHRPEEQINSGGYALRQRMVPAHHQVVLGVRPEGRQSWRGHGYELLRGWWIGRNLLRARLHSKRMDQRVASA